MDCSRRRRASGRGPVAVTVGKDEDTLAGTFARGVIDAAWPGPPGSPTGPLEAPPTPGRVDSQGAHSGPSAPGRDSDRDSAKVASTMQWIAAMPSEVDSVALQSVERVPFVPSIVVGGAHCPSRLRTHQVQRLVRSAQGGDRAAVASLLGAHRRTVERMCRSLCAGQAGYDDLVQDTYLGILANLGSFRGDAAFSTWIYTVARTQRSRSGRRRSHEPLPARYDAQLGRPWFDDLEARLRASEIAEQIEAAFAQLSSLDRTIVTMRLAQQSTTREVADELGLTEGAVKSRLRRALRGIRASLRALHTELAPCPEKKIAPPNCESRL